MAKNNILRDIFILVLVAAAFSLPFVNQAFHIDDTNFLYITKQVLKDPLRPYSFDINWRGTQERAFDILANPPLCPYYSALVIKLFGESEIILHSAYFIFVLLSAIFMYFLARRFTKNTLISSLLLISTPAFMVMSHTIMPDIALLAFYLAGITSFIYGVDKERKGLLVLSGIFMALAGLCRYSGLTVFFIALMYLFLRPGKIKVSALMPFAAGGLVFAAWCLHNIVFYAKLHFLAASGFQLVTLTLEDIFCKTEALLVYIGSTTVFFAFLIAGFLRREYRKAFFILLAAGIYFAVIAAMKYRASLPQVFLISIFMSASLFFFFAAIDRCIREGPGRKNRDSVFLLGWIGFIVLFTSSIYFAAVKHILLLLPPLIMLFVVMTEDFLGRYAKIYLSCALVFTFLSGLVISYADFKYANAYRDFAYRSVKKYKLPENSVWFVGHWGFQYYMEKLGCKALGYSDNSPKNNDILIMPSLIAEHQWPCKPLYDRLELLGVYRYKAFLPVRTMNARENFSFYTNIMLLFNPGFLPYYFSRQDLERFTVYRVD